MAKRYFILICATLLVAAGCSESEPTSSEPIDSQKQEIPSATQTTSPEVADDGDGLAMPVVTLQPISDDDPDFTTAITVVERNHELWFDCVRDLTTCDPNSYEETKSGPALEQQKAYIQEVLEGDEYVIAAEDPSMNEARILSIRKITDSEIQIVTCESDASPTVSPAKDGNPEITKGNIITRRSEYYLKETTEDTWHIHKQILFPSFSDTPEEFDYEKRQKCLKDS